MLKKKEFVEYFIFHFLNYISYLFKISKIFIKYYEVN